MKPWPNDAVMIVAAIAGEEIRKNMETPTPVMCRVCGRDLMACSYTIRFAEGLPVRRGRPIKFFCTECAAQHDPSIVTHMHDMSGNITKGMQG